MQLQCNTIITVNKDIGIDQTRTFENAKKLELF